MKYLVIFFVSALACLCASCHKSNNANGEFPDNYAAMGDTARVAFMMRNADPDSVARFICRGALGQLGEHYVDSLPLATAYAYEHYQGDQLDAFSLAYDNFIGSLPLNDKMRIYVLGGTEDPQGLGLRLGLEYVQSIRDNNLTVDDVEKELKAFKAACGADKDTYDRFIVGFRTVLKADNGTDLPKEIYNKFISYE